MCYRVSIVIPIYNAGDYLDRCIASVREQTYQDLEIILVNDGSADHSLEICERHAGEDERIVLINQTNQGVVKARQAGVEAASGSFVGWADADDWIEPGYIEMLVKLQKDSGADIVAAAHFHDIGDDSRLVRNGVDAGIYKTEQLVSVMLYTGKFFEYGITPQLYTKLFRADILKRIQTVVTDDIIAGDDAAVVYPGLLLAEKVCVSDLSGYHYVQHQGSITKTGFSDEEGRVRMLIAFLKNAFQNAHVSAQTDSQLASYENYMLALRKIDVFDADEEEKILIPFGGFLKDEKIIVYGAGVLGQQIYHYLKKDGRVNLTGWLDKNYEVYRKQGMPVDSPDRLSEPELIFDHILIANITESAAMAIKNFLLSVGVEEEKIRWFSARFRGKV